MANFGRKIEYSPMKPYKSVQSSWWLLIFPLIMVLLFLAYFFQLGDNPLPLVPMLLIEALFAGIYAAFYQFVVEVKETYIDIRYGVGWISFKIPLQPIKSVDLVKNPWSYGFGVRMIPNGTLYNITGLDAVELSFDNKKKVVRIGAKNVEALKDAIEAQIKK